MSTILDTSKWGYRVRVWDNGMIDIIIDPEVAEEFKLLVKRGANTFERASPETKEFVDLLLYGYSQQDYHSMPQFRGKEHGPIESSSPTGESRN